MRSCTDWTKEQYKIVSHELKNNNNNNNVAHDDREVYALQYGKTPQQNLGDTHAKSYV